MDINKTKPTPFPGFGNGLAADKDIEAGEVLLGITNPYLAIVENGALNQVCSQCFTEAPDGLKGCLGCSTVKYCSTACQSRAWESIHKKECRILRKLPQVPPTPVRGLMQLLLRKKVAGSASDPCWVRLEGHDMELKSNNRWDEIVLQATAAVEWTASPREYMESALDALCRVSFISPPFLAAGLYILDGHQRVSSHARRWHCCWPLL
jgi:SET and MYND domain-containing protein